MANHYFTMSFVVTESSCYNCSQSNTWPRSPFAHRVVAPHCQLHPFRHLAPVVLVTWSPSWPLDQWSLVTWSNVAVAKLNLAFSCGFLRALSGFNWIVDSWKSVSLWPEVGWKLELFQVVNNISRKQRHFAAILGQHVGPFNTRTLTSWRFGCIYIIHKLEKEWCSMHIVTNRSFMASARDPRQRRIAKSDAKG